MILEKRGVELTGPAEGGTRPFWITSVWLAVECWDEERLPSGRESMERRRSQAETRVRPTARSQAERETEEGDGRRALAEAANRQRCPPRPLGSFTTTGSMNTKKDVKNIQQKNFLGSLHFSGIFVSLQSFQW